MASWTVLVLSLGLPAIFGSQGSQRRSRGLSRLSAWARWRAARPHPKNHWIQLGHELVWDEDGFWTEMHCWRQSKPRRRRHARR